MKEKKVSEVLKAVLFIGISLWILTFILGHTYGHTLRQIIKTSKTGVIGLGLLEVIYLLIDSRTISMIVKRYRKDYSYREGLNVLLYGNFYKGITLGSGTKVAQIYQLSKQKVPVGVSSGMLTLQYAFHRIAVMFNATIMMCLFPVFGLFDYVTYKPYFIMGYIINMGSIIGMILLCLWQDFHHFVLYLIEKILVRLKKETYLKQIRLYFKELEKESRFLLEKPAWCMRVILVNCAKLMCWYVMPYVIYISVTGTKPGANLIEIMTLTAVMHLLLGVIPAPVGMGSTEVIYLILFTRLFGKVTTNSSMIIYRLFTYYLPFLLSILFMIGYNYVEKKIQNGKEHAIEKHSS